MIFELTGKRALVTGAGSGIGAAIAEPSRGRGHTCSRPTFRSTATRPPTDQVGGGRRRLALDVRDEAACADVGRRPARSTSS